MCHLARFVCAGSRLKEMPHPTVVCPHCGKKLANAEKLAWHLSRECPAFRPREERQRPVEGENSNVPAER